MPLLRNKDNKAFFLHIPKTAGNSIYDAVLWEGGRVEFNSLHTNICMSQHLNASRLDKFFPLWVSFNPFSIIRHPWDRLVSEYLYQTRNTTETQIDPVVFNAWFEDMMRIVGKTPWAFDNHFLPQLTFLWTETPVEIFTIENMNGVLKWLNETLDFDFPLEEMHSNASRTLKNRPEIDILTEENRKLFGEEYGPDAAFYNRVRGEECSTLD